MARYAESSRAAYNILMNGFSHGQRIISAARLECLRFVLENYQRHPYNGMICRGDIEKDYARWRRQHDSPIPGASSDPNTIARRLTDCVNIGVCAYIGKKAGRSARSVDVQAAVPTRLITPLRLPQHGDGTKPPEFLLLVQHGTPQIFGPFGTQRALYENAVYFMDEMEYPDTAFLMVIRKFESGSWSYSLKRLRRRQRDGDSQRTS